MHVFKRRKEGRALEARRKLHEAVRVWASVGARVTFRAELMPGRDAAERTYTVARLLSNGRIELAGLAGQHAQTEFEAVQSTSTIG
jgi:hypothetical protein